MENLLCGLTCLFIFIFFSYKRLLPFAGQNDKYSTHLQKGRSIVPLWLYLLCRTTHLTSHGEDTDRQKQMKIWKKNIYAKEVLDLGCLPSHRSLNTPYVWPPPKPCGTFVVSTFANCVRSSSFVTPFPRRAVEPYPHLRTDYHLKKKKKPNLTVPEMCLN